MWPSFWITYPLLIALVAVGILRRATNAATWSVFGRLINRSFWPRILRTDVASGKKVDRGIRLLSISSALIALILAVAAAITPLGLYATIHLQDSSDTPFAYTKDTSPIGLATPLRNGYQSNRVCKFSLAFIPCPGNDDGLRFYDNGSDYGVESTRPNSRVSSGVAANISDIFTSFTGKMQSTIAGPLDIEYRSFINYNNQTEPSNPSDRIEWIDGGAKRTQSRFRYYQQFILDNKAQAIEGLIVDTGATPGIGFRNHTLPPSSTLGYTWTEEILWLEPETACTNLNLTYDYTIPDTFSGPGVVLSDSGVPNARITDRGGIVNNAPELGDADLNDTQADPKLLLRSWRAAWMTNQIVSKYFNETKANARLGKTYSIVKQSVGGLYDPVPNAISFSKFGSAVAAYDDWSPSLPSPLDGLSRIGSQVNRTASNNTVAIDVGPIAVGYGSGDSLNVSQSGAHGGLMMGVATQVDATGNPVEGDDRYIISPGTNWTQPMYSCVSAVKASVKLVTFVVNGTNTLSSLTIQDIQPSNYTQDTLPTWAMEYSAGQIGRYSPFWGRISPEKASEPGIATFKSDRYYLPAGASAASPITNLDTIDGAASNTAPWIPFYALEMMYTSIVATSKTTAYPDYRGTNNWLLFSRWEELSQSASTAGRIRDLIWTDLMANMVVGTKSVLSTNGASPTSVNMPAEQYTQGIAYDWRYAIPALIFAVIFLLLLICSVGLFATRGLNIHVLRFMLNQTSAGRTMTTERYSSNQQEIDYAKTKTWARVRGDEMVRVGKGTAALLSQSGHHSPVDGKHYSALEQTKPEGFVQTHPMAPSPDHTAFHNYETRYDPQPQQQVQGGGVHHGGIGQTQYHG